MSIPLTGGPFDGRTVDLPAPIAPALLLLSATARHLLRRRRVLARYELMRGVYEFRGVAGS